MGAVTTASSTDLRERAETVLQQLAGPQARLREDQWTAIEALVAQHRRALVVQRTGWGSPRSTSSPPRCCVPTAPARR